MAYHDPKLPPVDAEDLNRLLREHKVLLETVQESPVHFCVYDPDDKLIAWNEAYEGNYPKTFRDLRAKAMRKELTYAALIRHEMSDVLTAEDLEKEVAHRVALQAAANGEPVVRDYFKNTLRVHKYRLPSGAVAGLAIDITDLTVRERELSEARQAAEASEASKARFLANMSHEIRTPMNGIMGLTALLAETDLNDAQRELVETISSSADALLLTINEVLDFSKIDAGKLEIVEDPFDVHRLIDEVANLLRPVADQKGVALKTAVKVDRGAWYVGDVMRIRQCLLNLLGNAVKFTREGTVSLSVSHNDTGLSLAVSDTGIGIADDKVEHVFSAFEQADTRTAREFEGTGLGLAITQRLVGLMKGEINVESQYGEGSTFSIHLPLNLASQSETVSIKLSASGESTGGRLAEAVILVAEDNRTNRMVVEKMLGPAVNRIDFALNGSQAVELFRTLNPDVILMDVSMPVMSGLDATRAIRKIEQASSAPPIPIVALTANAMAEDLHECVTAGMNAVLTKPVRKPDLLKTIEDALQQN